MKLTGNTIFITGGGSGIGRALAETLHKFGNKVIISGCCKGAPGRNDRGKSRNGFNRTERCRSGEHPPRCRRAHREVPKPECSYQQSIMQIDDASTNIDNELISSTIATNLIGPIWLTGAVVEHLKRQQSSSILIVSSVLGFTLWP